MNNVDGQYQEMLRKIVQEGNTKRDRTGTGTKSLFGTRMEFDLQEGFPILSLKETKLRLAFGELMWMASDGSTSSKELQDNYNVNFWRHWANEAGELPNVYGKQMTRSDGEKRVVKIERKIEDFIPYKYPIQEELEVDRGSGNVNVGKIFKNNKGHELKIIDHFVTNKRGHYKIQFTRTGSVRDIRADSVKKAKDFYEPIVCGVGFLGDGEVETTLDEKLYSVWQSMLERSYKENHPHYKYYGGKGVFVQGRWHDFGKFKEDVKHITNWHNKKINWDGYSLDKDYYGSNCYSIDSCVWLSNKEQYLYRTNNKPFKVIYPNGQPQLFIEREHCQEVTGISRNQLQRKLNNPERELEGFGEHIFEYVSSDKLLRYQLPVNQVDRVISEIKTNPNSRRLIIDNWSAYDLEHQALPSCHAFVQFNVEEGKLNCQMYQRSVDVMLGLPYNIVFYSLLTHMVAHLTGYEVGKFIHVGGDTHIYNNLIEMAEEVLQRDIQDNPTLTINREVEYLHEFKLTDFTLENYTPNPHIRGKVSV